MKIIYLYIATILILGMTRVALEVSDVSMKTFEDGSGRITFCLPMADCK